jgi:hypothetical protein
MPPAGAPSRIWLPLPLKLNQLRGHTDGELAAEVKKFSHVLQARITIIEVGARSGWEA